MTKADILSIPSFGADYGHKMLMTNPNLEKEIEESGGEMDKFFR